MGSEKSFTSMTVTPSVEMLSDLKQIEIVGLLFTLPRMVVIEIEWLRYELQKAESRADEPPLEAPAPGTQPDSSSKKRASWFFRWAFETPAKWWQFWMPQSGFRGGLVMGAILQFLFVVFCK